MKLACQILIKPSIGQNDTLGIITLSITTFSIMIDKNAILIIMTSA
jgi:hypothetical protein